MKVSYEGFIPTNIFYSPKKAGFLLVFFVPCFAGRNLCAFSCLLQRKKGKQEPEKEKVGI